MKILHTADWHLCDRLGSISRTDELKQRVEAVARLCEEQQIEVLIVAGDLFYERASVREIADSFQHIRTSFEPFFQRGGTMLAITGNHDDDDKIDLVRAGLSMAAPVPPGAELAGGRLYLQNGLSFCTLLGNSGEKVQFVLVPYPRASRYGLPADYRTREEEHRLLQGALTKWVADVFQRPSFDQSLPTVLVAHLHVRGANLNRSLFRLSEADDVLIDPAILKSGWAYVALGHIHAPQAVDQVACIRYPGPLDRLDFGEINDERGVITLEVGRHGLIGEPVWFPLPATSLYDVTLTDPDNDLPQLAERYPGHQNAIVRIVAHMDKTHVSLDELRRRLLEIFPRIHQLNPHNDLPTAAGKSSPVLSDQPGRVFEEVVREYLGSKLIGHTDRQAVLDLAERFLKTSGKEVPS